MSMNLSQLALCLLISAGGAPTSYPRANLLIEADELARSGNHFGKYHILDVRPEAAYQAGHIVGAVRVDHDQWAKAFAQAPGRKPWAKRIGATGIRDTDDPVLLYGDDVKNATRIWWILRYWGLKNVRLVNGGWQAWKAIHGPTEKGSGPAPSTGDATLTAQPARLATKEQLLTDLKEKRFEIIDARSQGEFCGDTKLAKRGGAIPRAKHLEWVELIDKKTQRFKPAPELAKLFKDAGIDPKRPAVTYCQSGGRASVTAFALELMGADEVRDYYRSWAEWGNADDTPVVRPQSK